MTLFFPLVLLCWWSANVSARSFDDIVESKYINIAVYNDYPPYSYLDADTARGIDVDIAKEIAAKLSVKLILTWMTPGETTEDDFRNYLWKGHIIHKVKADLMMRAPYDRSFSQKRDDIGLLANELVHMFAPYHQESWQIIHNTEQLPEVETMAMFQYHKIGAEIDSIPHFYLTSAFGGRLRKNTTQYASNELAIDAMKKGDVDAVMGLRTQISYLSQFLDNAKFQLASNAFPLIGKQKWDLGIAAKNDYRTLAYEVGDVITEMVQTGKMADIFSQYHATYEVPDYYAGE
ncbi:transporter substrate-binding domain-containing protein [Alteromonas sp. CI.11.F.A3]|nr:transporter substrate-binding domain-containing protein [Alteromonas sp. CI.11.F.A3]WOI39364.1 transporter substrate-binding domain-containing protein [Alteromonas sp. CI.11.F.A3]